MPDLMRHIRHCNNAVLPGRRLPVWIGGASVGWALPEAARVAAAAGGALDGTGLHLTPEALDTVARALAGRRLCRWRDEAFEVRPAPEGETLGAIDRGALPALGLLARGVHVNGLVGDRLWVARRAADKALDPGKLDHLVAGGIGLGYGLHDTLAKEGAEEAGLPPALAAAAALVGTVDYAMERPEGLRRDRLYCFDLELPAAFIPEPRDGEVAGFELWPLHQVLEAVRQTDDFKFNVNLVLIDLFIRRSMIAGDEAEALRAALTPPREVPN